MNRSQLSSLLQTAYPIMRMVEDAGGTSLIMGGAVRDAILGIESKDIDIEVYKLTIDQLKALLDTKGIKQKEVGESFAVIKISLDGQDFDLSIPRREVSTGPGYLDFDVFPDPHMSIAEAASRRDFTINTMGLDINGCIFDPFTGVNDLQAGVLKATSGQFEEDPLRVYRAANFIARFNLTVEATTHFRCCELFPKTETLPVERIYTELHKILIKGISPSLGLDFLREVGCYTGDMAGCKQDPIWHPEGDVWEHTMLVVDAARGIAREHGLNEDDTWVLMLAALLHDCGKPETSIVEEGRIRSPGHAEVGAKKAKRFLEFLKAPNSVIDGVVPLVKEHMVSIGVDPTPRIVRRLANRLHPSTIQLWSILVEADKHGPGGVAIKTDDRWLKIAEDEKVENDKPKPILMGRHLIEHFEMKPGEQFGVILKAAFEAQLDGMFKG